MSFVPWNDLVESWESGNRWIPKTFRMPSKTKNTKKQDMPMSTPIVMMNAPAPVKSKKKKSVSPRKTQNGYDFNRVFSEISSTFTTALSNPLVLLTIALATGVFVTHDFSNKKGFIYDTFKDRNDSISTWITAHGMKFAGMLMFLPAVIDSPQRYRSIIALVSFLWVMVIPEANAGEYFLQSLALHTYFKLKSNNSKLTVLVIVGAAWFLGYFKLKSSSK